MSSLRIFLIGGLTSYRALFNWLTPWILIPSFILGPIFQILFFAYVGRTAGVGSDSFFLIGNAVLYASIPCLFAMGNTIGGERQQGTLPLLLASPAYRIPLFLGRARARARACLLSKLSLTRGTSHVSSLFVMLVRPAVRPEARVRRGPRARRGAAV